VTDAHRFRAELIAARGGGSMFVVPVDVAAALGPAKRPPVTVTVGGHTFRTRIAVYGGESLVGVSKANRAAAGIDIGDGFDVEIAVDTEPREVVVPDDLAAALAEDPAVGEAFDALAFTHRREYVLWVEGAKRPETRARRVAGTVERLRSGEPGGPR
jgi:hypothetical protein